VQKQPNQSNQSTFKAAVLVETKQPLQILQLMIPAVGPDQILIKIKYAGICGSQLMEVDGMRGPDNWLPHALGHEAVGIVTEIGSMVEGFIIGEKVILSWLADRNIQIQGSAYTTVDGAQINAGPVNTFSEMALVHKSRVHKVSGNFSDQFLPLFGCALLTGVGMVLSNFVPNKHKKVLVIGFGGIGSAAAIALEIFPGTEIFIMDTSPDRLKAARELGFVNTLLINPELEKSFPDGFYEFDFCIESAGKTKTIELGIALIKDSGTLVFASHPPIGDKIEIDPYDLIKGKRIIGTWGGDLLPENSVEQVSAHISKSKLPLNLLIGQIFSLNQINEAIEYLRRSNKGRPIIDCGGI
jgi:S-(hydroxymethyl)glutathione dehydrogenase/alcohol dehydrogenase